MRVLLPLNNNNQSSTEETQQQEHQLNYTLPTGFQNTSITTGEVVAEKEQDLATCLVLSPEPEAQERSEDEEELLHPRPLAGRATSNKRDHLDSLEGSSKKFDGNHSVSNSKRLRLCSSNGNDDSKPAAKPMVAPKRQHSSPNDGKRHHQNHHTDSRWEENEPTPFGNMQHYYRNHPWNNARLVSTTSTAASSHHQNLESSSSTAATAAASGGPPINGDPLVSGEETEFASALKRVGLEIVEQEGDGNCLFRAVGLQVYGDASMHGQVREQCLNFMAVNKEHFGQFMTAEETFESYISRKRQIGVHGNNPEIQAISELFNRPVQIFSPSTGANPLNIFHKEYKTSDAPIRLSYHDNNHYNAVTDPSNPTAGLGLGLPGLQPGLADKLQVAAATTESDLQSDLDQAIAASQKDYSKLNDDQLQRALKESSFSVDSMYKNKALALSDVDATNFELEQTILETSLQSFYDSSQEDEGRKQRASPGGRRRRTPSSSSETDRTDTQCPVGEEPRQAPVAAAAAMASPPSPEHDTSVATSSPLSVRAAAHSEVETQHPSLTGTPDEYPSVVQELVMNGFDLKKVVHAYELFGDKFDDLLAFLMSSGTT